MFGDYQGIELSDYGQTGPWTSAKVHLSLDARDGQAIGVRHAHGLELVLHYVGGAVLVEPRFGVFQKCRGRY